MTASTPKSGLGVCVAPTYPEWAATEDGDWVWVRLDLADWAEEVASVALDNDLPCALDPHGVEFMWLDLLETDWAEDWILREVTADADEAVAYARYEVVDRDLPLTDEEYDRIDGHA